MRAQSGGPLSAQQNGNPSGRYTLNGTVINSVTGEPVPHALVQLFSSPQRAMLTGADGSFQFDGVPGGQISVSARKPGFFRDEEVGRRTFYQAFQFGPDSGPITLRLNPEGVVIGRVEDENGESIEGAAVRAASIRITNGRRLLRQMANAVSDADGEFRIANLTPGAYYISVAPAASPGGTPFGISFPPSPEEAGYPAIVYYPDAPDLASSMPLELTLGQRAQIAFTLKRRPVFHLAGAVAGQLPGMPVRLSFSSAAGMDLQVPVTVNPQTGEFEAKRVPGGTYILKAEAQDTGGHLFTAEAPLSIASNLTGIRLLLQPAPSIPVIVRTEFTKNPPIQTVPYRHQFATVHLNPTQLEQPEAWATMEGPQENRALAIRNVSPGRYVVEATPNGPWYVQSLTSGSADLFREELAVAAGASVDPIEVVLRDDGASLTTTVRSELDAPCAVIIAPDFAPLATPKLVNGRTRNQLEVAGLAPGDYTVFAFDNIGGLEYANREALAPYVSQAAHVTLSASGKSSVTLDLIQRAE
ncbi:MAG TPA: carboxypeptidase-like regulatory domain-containing protein [Terriglobales bacterium]